MIDYHYRAGLYPGCQDECLTRKCHRKRADINEPHMLHNCDPWCEEQLFHFLKSTITDLDQKGVLDNFFLTKTLLDDSSSLASPTHLRSASRNHARLQSPFSCSPKSISTKKLISSALYKKRRTPQRKIGEQTCTELVGKRFSW